MAAYDQTCGRFARLCMSSDQASFAKRPTTAASDLSHRGIVNPKSRANLAEDITEFAGRTALVGQSTVALGCTSAAGRLRLRPSAMIACAKPYHVVAPVPAGLYFLPRPVAPPPRRVAVRLRSPSARSSAELGLPR